eukprot:TRINITY_DN789_c0_g1_i3.p1 TRINITY_DN789_c0_g1~~TRINITY_DN789_c0_g1_i3.p1  ORF type:complete len:582 (-),score=159.50 TRINITY_DN789_c0_g1_i3:140-1885(-)
MGFQKILRRLSIRVSSKDHSKTPSKSKSSSDQSPITSDSTSSKEEISSQISAVIAYTDETTPTALKDAENPVVEDEPEPIEETYDEEDPESESEDETFVGEMETIETANRKEGDFSCLSPEDIISRQHREIRSVADLCNVSHSVAGSLLRHFQWKKERLIAAYFENSEKVKKEAGIQQNGKEDHASIEVSRSIQLSGEEMCSICADEVPADQCTALTCQHRFCNDCWRNYLNIKIREGDVKIKCPQTKCNMSVDDATVKALTSPEVYDRFVRFITKSFVEDSDGRVKWCPQPNCGNAITTDMIKGTVVKCSCGYRFCFSCHREAHDPASCEQVKEWEKKCADDSETNHWKYANCKDCPKCELSVEKNGGCNHMTCFKCKFEWCWVCMRPWKGHNDYYNCNKFIKQNDKKTGPTGGFFTKGKKKDKAKEREEQREKNRIALERYLHYYERYLNHSHSRDLEKQFRDKAAVKMGELQKEATTSSEVQYILEGTEALLECRNVLKFTYVFAYYLPETGPKKELFEYLQEDLEKTTEQLAEIIEHSGVKRVDRLNALNVIQLATTRRANLIKSVEQGLTDEESST